MILRMHDLVLGLGSGFGKRGMRAFKRTFVRSHTTIIEGVGNLHFRVM
jgi:hypothetical protein